MNHRPFVTSLAVVAVAASAACSGGRGGQGPIYDLRATEVPLRYSMESSSLTVVELPTGGEQRVETSTTGTLSVEYGQPTDAGLPFTLIIEELDVTAATGAPDLSALIGTPIRGVAQRDGNVEVTEAPDVNVPGFDSAGLGQLISPLIVPLPPDGDPTAESWPLQVTRSTGDIMQGEASFDGTVRFTPAERWNGTPARIIVSEGDVDQRASGQPPGSPGEVDLEGQGESTTTYVWDPAEGAVLHVDRTAEIEGTVSTQGMALPLTVTTTETYTKLP